MNDQIKLAINSIVSSIKEIIRISPFSRKSAMCGDTWMIFLTYRITSKSKCEDYSLLLRKKMDCNLFRINDISFCENGDRSSGLDMNIEISLTTEQMDEYCIESKITEPQKRNKITDKITDELSSNSSKKSNSNSISISSYGSGYRYKCPWIGIIVFVFILLFYILYNYLKYKLGFV
jgi:hypothetical protein